MSEEIGIMLVIGLRAGAGPDAENILGPYFQVFLAHHPKPYFFEQGIGL